MSSLRGFIRCMRPVLAQPFKDKLCLKAPRPQLNNYRCFSVSACRLAERYFAESHEYVSVEGDVGTVGISDHAQGNLGDLVYVQLPDVDAEVEKGGEVGAVESVKAASDIYSPVSGTVKEVNQKLEDEPTLINNSPYDDGWLFKITISSPDELQELMSEEAYAKFIETDDH